MKKYFLPALAIPVSQEKHITLQLIGTENDQIVSLQYKDGENQLIYINNDENSNSDNWDVFTTWDFFSA